PIVNGPAHKNLLSRAFEEHGLRGSRETRRGCVATMAGDGWEADKRVRKETPPAIFQWRQAAAELIVCAVRWYLRYLLSLRDVEELLNERGLEADHTTVWRWVQRYGPELEQRLSRHLKPTNKSWRVDETYIRVKGRWCYLYR